MIGRRALLGGLLASASAAGAQTFRLGRSPQFRSGLRFPLKTIRAWLPTDATSAPLALWIDPSDASTLTLDTSNRVTQARDKSGNGNHFGVASYATYGSGVGNSGPNSLKAFFGLGGSGNPDGKLVSTTAGLNNVTAGANTIVCVAAAPSGYATYQMTGFAAISSNRSNKAYGWSATNGYANQGLVWRHGTYEDNVGTASVYYTGSVTILTRSGTTMTYYAQGTQANTSTNATSFTTVAGGWKICGWADQAGYGDDAPGWTGDCLIYTGVLSTSDRQKLEGYLAWKWGSQGNLPGDHPYSSAAPTT